MASIEHVLIQPGELHVVADFEYADATARGAAAGFAATDVGKFAWQLDNNSIWLLVDDSPITWEWVGGDLDTLAPLASPTFTGTPAAPTAAGGTNTTQIATTAFVQQELGTFDADDVTFDPTGLAIVVGTDVQAAIEELDAAIDAGTAPSGSAGGVLDGSYPNPGLAASVAGAGLTETTDVLSVNVDDSTIEINTDTLRVKDSGITNAKLANAAKEYTINFIIDGGGSTITTGIKGDIQVDAAGTIISATLLADQSGAIVVDIWNDTYANFPPTDADSITAAAPPTISGPTDKSTDSTLTGWDTAIAAGDILRINVDSVTSLTRCTLALKIRRS